MPKSPAEQLAFAAKLIRDRAGKRKVKERGDSAWMLELAAWLEFEAECLASGEHGDDPASEYALNVARAYLGETEAADRD